MANTSEIVNEIIVSIVEGNITDAVEKLLHNRKTYPCRVAIISSMVTESLINNKQFQELKFFVNKLEYYNTHNIKG